MTQEIVEQRPQMTDESLQTFFPVSDSDGLKAWNTEQLVTDVLLRYTDDAPALRRLQSVILQAWLAAIDRQAAPAAR